MAAVVEAAETVEQVIEDAKDLVTVEELVLTGRRALALGFVGGAAVGGTSVYFFLKRRIQRQCDEELDREVATLREHFRAKEVARQERTEKKDLTTVVEELGYKTPEVSKPDKPLEVSTESVETNVFENSSTPMVWNYDTEVANRNPAQPYILHREEFHTGDAGHDQSTLTYFAGDDVLCDERDTPVDNRDAMVGDENLEKFGHGSEDPNVVYIRNEPLGIDFEIVRSEGKFAQEVHGFSEDELQHSERRRRAQRGFSDD